MRNLVLESLNSKRLCNLASRLWITGTPIKSTDDFLRSKFIYTEEKIETLVAPEYSIQGLEQNGVIRGDCDDISILHAALLTCMDIKVRFVAIRSTKEDANYDHVFIEAFDGVEWILHDITVPRGTPIEYYSRIAVNV